MNYWEFREQLKTILPRKRIIETLNKERGLVKEKGRKKNYFQYDLITKEMVPIRRLLNEESIGSFLEVSLRASCCPMCLNMDLYDSIRCGFGCKFCFADSFRASLYTSFFDNSDNIGTRYCHPDYFKRELDKLMKVRGTKAEYNNELQNAIALQMPIRLGIRFENFLPIEKKERVSLELLKYLKEIAYPIMINTKSNMVGDDEYVKILSENKGGAAIHITINSSNSKLNSILEPKAPPFEERAKAALKLEQAGIRVVARIEPFMAFVNDDQEDVKVWIETMKSVGVKHVTLDTYSYNACTPGIRRQMEAVGIDYERMYGLMSESQWLGSLILGKFMEELRKKGFSCSTFDFGCSPSNNQDICCEVGDYFSQFGSNFSYGNANSAIRFICSQKGKPVTWDFFERFVEEKGGWLSNRIRQDVFSSWNLARGNPAYFVDWGQGIIPYGVDNKGIRIWKYDENNDFREELFRGLIK